ncbi:MAG: response regulator [Thermoanaerobaculia bacterium]
MERPAHPQQNGDVLVADDDASISAMVTAVITREGLRVERAATGEDALVCIRSSDYSAILLDLMLPKRTGFDVLDCLRKSKPGHLKRVVVMTASPRQLKRLDVTELMGVLIKPFDIDDLRKLILTAVNHARQSH